MRGAWGKEVVLAGCEGGRRDGMKRWLLTGGRDGLPKE